MVSPTDGRDAMRIGSEIQGLSTSVSAGVLAGGIDAPHEELRIVTFIDLVGSTGLAEELGSLRFYALLSDALTRLSDVVTAFGGEVHRTVGDALIATWPLANCRENARAILAVLACREALESAAPAFRARHSCVPEFRASLHCGPLVVAAIGAVRGEIALIGDAMNTAARIEQASRATGHRLLVSRALLMRTALPADIVATSIGASALRGKAERLELFAVARRTACASRPAYHLRACA